MKLAASTKDQTFLKQRLIITHNWNDSSFTALENTISPFLIGLDILKLKLM